MAWEEESIESGVDFEEVGGKNSKIKLIIIILAVLALLAGGYWAYDKFMAGGDDKPVDGKDGTGQTDGGNGGDSGDSGNSSGNNGNGGGDDDPLPSNTPGFPVNLEKFTLNLSGSSTPHYLVVTMALEVTSAKLKERIEDPNDQYLYTIKIRDAILEILRSKSYEEVKDPATSEELKKEIKFRLDRLFTEGKVKSVYFNEFLID